MAPQQAPSRTPGIPGLQALLQQIVENYSQFTARWQADPEDPRFEAELRVLKSLSAGVLALCRLENQTARLQLARERFDLQLEKHRASNAKASVSTKKAAPPYLGTERLEASATASIRAANGAAPPPTAAVSPAERSAQPRDAVRSGNASAMAACPDSSGQTFLAGSIAECLSPPARETAGE